MAQPLEARRSSGPPPDRKGAGLAAVGAAAALWAIAATVARDLFADGMPPLELAAARSFVAVIGFALVPGAWRRPDRTLPVPFMIALGLAIALVNAVHYLAIQHLEVAVAIVLQYTAPTMVVAWTALVMRRRPQAQVAAALVAALAGVVLVSEIPSGDLGRLDFSGISFGLAAAVMFATYTLLSETAGRAYGPAGAMLRAFAASTAFWIVFQATRGWPSDLVDPDNLPRVLYVGIAGTIAPFLLFVWGVRRIAAERATIAATLEPVVAAAAAWVWLGEALSVMQVAGGALVIGAVLILQSRRTLVSEP